MTKKEYAIKLLDPRWKIKRIDILERDNYQCRSCGDKDNVLHVHHKFYIDNNDPWDYDDSVLMTLCQACHKLHHLLLSLNSKDFPPLFLPPFKKTKVVVFDSDMLKEDYYLVGTHRRVPFAIRRQLIFINKLRELAHEETSTSFETVIEKAQDKLNDMCIRSNAELVTKERIYGAGDVTNLKPEQYL